MGMAMGMGRINRQASLDSMRLHRMYYSRVCHYVSMWFYGPSQSLENYRWMHMKDEKQKPKIGRRWQILGDTWNPKHLTTVDGRRSHLLRFHIVLQRSERGTVTIRCENDKTHKKTFIVRTASQIISFRIEKHMACVWCGCCRCRCQMQNQTQTVLSLSVKMATKKAFWLGFRSSNAAFKIDCAYTVPALISETN